MDLTKLTRPWTASDGEIPIEWTQSEFYGKPVIAARIEELVGRISLFSTDGASLLRLWDPEHETLNVREVLAGLQLPFDRYTVTLSSASRTPIETGYLECMHLVGDPDGIAADDAIAAFAHLQLDRYRGMERHLIDCYGTLTPERAADPRFRGIDYPAFDLGPVQLGLGLFVSYERQHMWCWSRVVNWHK